MTKSTRASKSTQATEPAAAASVSVDATAAVSTAPAGAAADPAASPAASPAATPAASAAPSSATTPFRLAGVDVASFQGTPSDWLSAAGDFVWAAVKFTELEPGGIRYTNPDAAADWDSLKASNKGRVAYFFGHPSVNTTETVDFFLSELNNLGLHDTDGVALDLEVSDGLTPAEVTAWAADVLSQVQSRIHRVPLLYTFIDFASAGYCATLGGYPLWIAAPSFPPGKPEVPAPWKTWAVHQYDISGNIDRDLANYENQTTMFTALGNVVPPKPPEPEVQNLGGNVSAVSSARWPDGKIVVAGLGADGFVQTTVWANNAWGAWKTVSPTKAKGVPSVISWVDGHGKLFYIEESGAVVEMTTEDNGATWS
jgi:lysozyme